MMRDYIKRGEAECWGHSNIFTAIARASGIPAWEVWGPMRIANHHLPRGELCGHVWVPVEPQRSYTLGMLPISYIRMCHYDIENNYKYASFLLYCMGGNKTPFYYQKKVLEE